MHPSAPYDQFRDWLTLNWEHVASIALSRSTQTNEAGRCAVLLPVLARLTGPLSLIEAGASAGLCLFPDRYSYEYDTGDTIERIDPAGGPSLVTIPYLNPIDVRHDDQMAWLETLVWPEHDERRRRLKGAARIVAADPPQIVRGDIVDETRALVASAPSDTHVVVFHSSVLVYMTLERRREFVDVVTSLPNVTWIVNGEPAALVGPHGQSYVGL